MLYVQHTNTDNNSNSSIKNSSISKTADVKEKGWRENEENKSTNIKIKGEQRNYHYLPIQFIIRS